MADLKVSFILWLLYALFQPAEPFVPYRVSLNATVCDANIQVYSQIVYTQRGISSWGIGTPLCSQAVIQLAHRMEQ